MRVPPQARLLPDRRRLHLQHGPIDLVIDAVGGDTSGTPAPCPADLDTVIPDAVQREAVLRRSGTHGSLSEPEAVHTSCEPWVPGSASRPRNDGTWQPRKDLQHDEGPAVIEAYRAATARFATILDELCAELPLLRAAAPPGPCRLVGRIARRMDAAVRPFAVDGFVTPMAAVAGAVAEEVLAAMTAAAPLRRTSVNNGGDIALHLAPGESLCIGLVDRPARPSLFGAATVRAEDGIRGVATSGWRGRSFSLGIADAVTILARTAAEADAAATIVANAVDLPSHPAVSRMPARDVQEDSDLGGMLVTRGVGPLSRAEIDEALARGVTMADELIAGGLIEAAALYLQGTTVMAHMPSPLRGGRNRAKREPGGGGAEGTAGVSPCATPTPALRFAPARPSPQGGG